VLVTRETDFERLLAVHATREQAAFFLRSRGQGLEGLLRQHEGFQAALHAVQAAIPTDWRVVKAKRDELDRFLFGPEDVVLVVGQDGLVANVAKYLRGQPVLGVNPAPDQNEGALVRLRPDRVGRLLAATAERTVGIERRTMAEARLDDGRVLIALNEIFVGHRSHQSARYTITTAGQSERQSSSGVIVATGTGATGWARSIMESTRHKLPLLPEDRKLAFFVREPWASVATGAEIAWGAVEENAEVTIVSSMNDGGVIFADGLEQDHLRFDWGRTVHVRLSAATLNLVREG
jgi:hypothetical protein